MRAHAWRTALALLLTAWTWACEPMPEPFRFDLGDGTGETDVGGEAAFAAPEGLGVAGDYLVVANSAFGYDGGQLVFGPGFATIVDRRDRRVVNRVPMPAKNPQFVAVADGHAWVLCSGQTAFDGTQVTPRTDGALAGIRIEDLATADAPDVVIPITLDASRPLVGYPSSLTILDGQAWIGSGTSPALFVLDLATGTWTHGPDDPILLGDPDEQDTMAVASGPDGRLLVASYNRDLIWMLDAGSGQPVAGTPFEVGTPGTMDGALSLAWRPEGTPDLFVLLGMASGVAAVSIQDSGPQVLDRFIVNAGSLPNMLLVDGDRLLVLNSGDNNVRAFDAATGAGLPFQATMPPAANPYAMAVGDVGQRHELYVTGLGSDTVYVFDASAGSNPGATRDEIR
jgi:outer membrane protein assembly factor BamB